MTGAMKRIGCGILAAGALSGSAAFSVRQTPSGRSPATASSSQCTSRREVIDIFAKAAVGAAAASLSGPASALDFDSFEKSLIEKDTTECNSKLDPKCVPKLTPDEALCKYGVSGAEARTAACRRVRDAGGDLPTSKPGERKTQGWLNGDIALTYK